MKYKVGDLVYSKNNIFIYNEYVPYLKLRIDRVQNTLYECTILNYDNVRENFGIENWYFEEKHIDGYLSDVEYTWTSKFNIGDKVVDEFDEIFYYIVSEVIHGVGGNVFYRFRNSFRTIHEDDLTLYEEPKKVTIELTQEQLDNIKSQGLI